MRYDVLVMAVKPRPTRSALRRVGYDTETTTRTIRVTACWLRYINHDRHSVRYDVLVTALKPRPTRSALRRVGYGSETTTTTLCVTTC